VQVYEYRVCLLSVYTSTPTVHAANDRFPLLPRPSLVSTVIDECIEFLRDPEDAFKVTEKTRQLGLVVCRGPQVSLISPTDGMEQIDNPFDDDDDEDDAEDATAMEAA